MLSSRRSILLCAIAVASALGAAAKDGRDFAGFYSLTNSGEEAGQVRATITLQLFNYSGADIDQAAVTIHPAPGHSEVLGTYSPITEWRDGSDVKFVLHVNVPREDYERWGGRRQPAVSIVTRDEKGREMERPAQVSQRPGIPLEESAAQ